MNSIIAFFSVLLLLLPLAMGWKWYLLLGNFQNCFAFSSSSPREREREREGEREHFGKRSISVSVLAAQYNVGGGLGRGWRGCKSASDSASSIILFIFSSPPLGSSLQGVFDLLLPHVPRPLPLRRTDLSSQHC